MQSAIIITWLYQICLLKVSLVGSFKHLPDSRGTQITAYLCMQLASKSSSFILCIIHGSSQPISLSFMVLKTCKIQRENILKTNRQCDSRKLQLWQHFTTTPISYKLFLHLYSVFQNTQICFFIIILDFVTLGFPILFSSDNKTLRPSKPPRLKLNSKCFSANPLSPILVTVC